MKTQLTRIGNISTAHRTLLLLLLPFYAVGGKPQSRYLKEILMGRCYYRPPDGGESGDACPSLVGGVVGATEGRNDGGIVTTDFRSYWDVADFTSPTDAALFMSTTPVVGAALPLGWSSSFVRVEETPGGALLDKVRFCGADKKQNCRSISGAYVAFWSGAYAAFASSAKGLVRAVVTSGVHDQLNDTLFGSAAVPNLDPTKVTGVDLFLVPGSHLPDEDPCAEASVLDLMNALVKRGFSRGSVTCTVDPLLRQMTACGADTSDPSLCQCVKEGNQQAEAPGGNKAAPSSEVEDSDQQGPPIVPIFFGLLLGGCLIAVLAYTHTTWGGTYHQVPDVGDARRDPEVTLPKQ